MHIRKSTGELVPYNPNKIRKTLRRAGANKNIIDRLLTHIEQHVYDGMTTKELYAAVNRELKKNALHIAQRYNLRSALLRLGPAGFKFEKYVASILRSYGFEAITPELEMRGRCVRHEIDVVATKDGTCAMIEAKFRNNFGDSVNLKDTMATWSRFTDLVDGADEGTCRRFDEVWVMTNGRFSDRALRFGLCKGMRMVGWNTKEHSLAKMVDHASLYPVTALGHLRQWELDRLANKGLMLCREVADYGPERIATTLDVSRSRASRIFKECRAIVTLDR